MLTQQCPISCFVEDYRLRQCPPRAGLSLSDAQGTDRVGGPLLTKAKLKAGSHPRNNKLFVLQMVQIE